METVLHIFTEPNFIGIRIGVGVGIGSRAVETHHNTKQTVSNYTVYSGTNVALREGSMSRIDIKDGVSGSNTSPFRSPSDSYKTSA